MATEPYPDHAWQRLADLLIQRRAHLDPKYRNRQAFADEKQLDYRVVSDIEKHRRTNFSAPMIASLEVAYRWAPGSIKTVLAGGNPTPLAGNEHLVRRLGDLLIERRIRIDQRFATRAVFAAEAGLAEEFIVSVERGDRTGLTGTEAAALEKAYRWAQGSVAAVLAGGDPTPRPVRHVTGSAHLAAAASTTAAGKTIPAPPADIPERFRATWAGLSDWQRALMSATDLPVDLRIKAIGYVLGEMMAGEAKSEEGTDTNGAHAS